VGAQDQFCAACGARQPVAASPAGGPASPLPPSSSAKIQNAASLCYIPFVGWIASLYVLATDAYRRDQTTRFHAFQGLYLFVTFLIVDRVIGPFISYRGFDPEDAAKLALFGAGIYLLIVTSQGKLVKLPVLGELAEKSVQEQQ
jgi:uncharacterized membrane protein